MRKPDGFDDDGMALFNWVTIDPEDGSALIDIDDDSWIDHEGLIGLAKDARDAVEWYAARTAARSKVEDEQ